MYDGTVGKWYKKEGESARNGEPIVGVVPEKTSYYSEASFSGIRRKVLAQAGVNVSVNALVRAITASDETFSEVETCETVGPQNRMGVLKKRAQISTLQSKRLESLKCEAAKKPLIPIESCRLLLSTGHTNRRNPHPRNKR